MLIFLKSLFTKGHCSFNFHCAEKLCNCASHVVKLFNIQFRICSFNIDIWSHFIILYSQYLCYILNSWRAFCLINLSHWNVNDTNPILFLSKDLCSCKYLKQSQHTVNIVTLDLTAIMDRTIRVRFLFAYLHNDFDLYKINFERKKKHFLDYEILKTYRIIYNN